MVKIQTDVHSRKARRKQERQGRKKRPRYPKDDAEDAEPAAETPVVKKAKKSKKATSTTNSIADPNDPYANMDPSVAAALRKEDEEIEDLEGKLGLGNKKEKSRLHKEYAKLEGYGDDFGDFLDELDTMVARIAGGNDEEEANHHRHDSYHDFDSGVESEPDEEEVPMKGEPIRDDDDSLVDETDSQDSEEYGGANKDCVPNEDDPESGDEMLDETSIDKVEPDHSPDDTYKPRTGEDIYGKATEQENLDCKPGKYVPPHLRNKEDSEERQEKLRALTRQLNNALNRLSEDTMISVAQQVTQIYKSFPTSDVNEYLWKNVFNAAVDRPMVMATMIPVYVACLVGVHFQTGDTVQLGGYLVEQIVTKLWTVRNQSTEDESKESSNLMLCLCYLYNYGLVHSGFMFDIVRKFIEAFAEEDIELLLLLLSHAGHALRSDDPLALKDIVLSVQKKESSTDEGSSSRVEYMISAMTDLKNNKRRKQDMVYSERTTKLRKFLGRIKSEAFRSADSSCLRIRLQDILDVETKGRWWKVGASWVGNQFTNESGDDRANDGNKARAHDEEEEELLKLASKYRMNTDSRRSIFCIIMGSADCDDAFEKLVRSGMLKNRTERDCVRVLVECCGNEANYNPFYSHLASRICDYQPQCKFTFQLAFWDIFKQWDTVQQRKAANLAKLLYHMVAVHQSLKLSILKTLDIAELEESALIFLTIFFSTMFESIEEQSNVVQFFEKGVPKSKPGQEEDGEGLLHSLSVFFLQTLKSSPKNKKGSQFRRNLKAAIKACETNDLDAMK